jgi:hypothetical protein
MTKILRATHGSTKTPLKIGNLEIPCYVLEGGMRVLSQRGVNKALGRPEGGASEGADKLPSFLGLKSLKLFISKELIARILIVEDNNQIMKCEEISRCCENNPIILTGEFDNNGYCPTIICCEKCEFSGALKRTLPEAIRWWNQMLYDIGI